MRVDYREGRKDLTRYHLAYLAGLKSCVTFSSIEIIDTHSRWNNQSAILICFMPPLTLKANLCAFCFLFLASYLLPFLSLCDYFIVTLLLCVSCLFASLLTLISGYRKRRNKIKGKNREVKGSKQRTRKYCRSALNANTELSDLFSWSAHLHEMKRILMSNTYEYEHKMIYCT